MPADPHEAVAVKQHKRISPVDSYTSNIKVIKIRLIIQLKGSFSLSSYLLVEVRIVSDKKGRK